MHWSDQVDQEALGVSGHPISSYNDVYYPRADSPGSFPTYENSSDQVLFRDESSFPFRWVFSFSSTPENLEDPATWSVVRARSPNLSGRLRRCQLGARVEGGYCIDPDVQTACIRIVQRPGGGRVCAVGPGRLVA
jgi:hypothetical protein